MIATAKKLDEANNSPCDLYRPGTWIYSKDIKYLGTRVSFIKT